jgi:diacylglycerol kinase family enzyme
MRETFRSCMLLINPVRNPHRANRVKRALQESGFNWIVTSRSRDHFIDSVSEFLKSSSKYLVVWGGDGSIHDAVNRMMREGYSLARKGDKVLGFLRGGSGNGYHDSYEVPRSLFRQVRFLEQCIRKKSVRAVDLLKIECSAGTIYGQLAGFGFDAAVAKRRKIAVEGQKGKGGVFWGLLQYFLSTIGAVIHDFSSVKWCYTAELVGEEAIPGLFLNGEHLERFSQGKTLDPVMIEVGKRQYYGNKFRICPHAVQNDGKLWVYFFFVSRRMPVIRHLFSLWKGKYSRINKRTGSGRSLFVAGYAAEALRLYPDVSVPFHVDGELYGEAGKKSSGFTISIVPEAVSFLVPHR